MSLSHSDESLSLILSHSFPLTLFSPHFTSCVSHHPEHHPDESQKVSHSCFPHLAPRPFWPLHLSHLPSFPLKKSSEVSSRTHSTHPPPDSRVLFDLAQLEMKLDMLDKQLKLRSVENERLVEKLHEMHISIPKPDLIRDALERDQAEEISLRREELRHLSEQASREKESSKQVERTSRANKSSKQVLHKSSTSRAHKSHTRPTHGPHTAHTRPTHLSLIHI